MRTHRYKRSNSKHSKSKRNKRTRRTKKVGGGNLAKKLQQMKRTCEQKVAKATTSLKKAELSHELTQKIEVLTNCKAQVDTIPAFENLQQVTGASPSFGNYNTPKKASGAMGFSSSFGKYNTPKKASAASKGASPSFGNYNTPKKASGAMGFADDESL
jgi:hypothetical protein